jgi:hypothetical protein
MTKHQTIETLDRPLGLFVAIWRKGSSRGNMWDKGADN